MPKNYRINLSKFLLLSGVTGCMALPGIAVHAQFSGGDVGFAGIDVCKPGIIDVPAILKDAPSGDPSELPTGIEADEIETESKNPISLKGNAQIVQGKRGVYADKIIYDQDAYQATAQGNVIFYTSNGDEIRADALEMEVDTFIGSAENANIKLANSAPDYTERQHRNYVEDYSILAPFKNKSTSSEKLNIPNDDNTDDNTYVRARATAEIIDFEGADYQLLHNATITTCEEGNQDVMLYAKEMELDHVSGIGTAKAMKVKFKNVPIFYFPIISFPINDERKTGFLFPGIGYEKESGFILDIPYYINIAANRDATIIPRILSHRGIQLYGEYRYLTENSKGEIKAEILPSDNVFNDDRHAFSFNHDQDFNDDWSADVDLQDVSDTNYLRDFESDVDAVASSFISQRANLNYHGDKLRFRGRLAAYEPVNDNVSLSGRPHERLPELSLDLREQDIGNFQFGIESQYIDFAHDDNSLVTGTRLRIKPYLSLPFEKIYGYVTPKVSVQSISYSLDNNPTGDNSPSVSVPIVSVDSGLFFDRVFKRSENIYLQTLEPRLFYLNIPDELEQEAFPDFDTGDGSSSSFAHFFREDRFFGGDRVGDTEQVTLGLTSRIINDETGDQKFSISLGQVFFMEDRKVGLTIDSVPETASRSDFLAEATASITDDWSIRTFARRGEESNALDFVQVSANYRHSNRRNATISYSRSRNLNEQININIEAPIRPRWQLDLRINYSLEDNEARSSLIGLSYDGCCWAASFGTQRYLDGTGTFKNRFLMTFELNDLGKLRPRL